MVETKKSARDRVKIRSSHDVLDNDPRLSRQVAVDVAREEVAAKQEETSKPASVPADDAAQPEEQFDREMREKILAKKAEEAAKHAPKKLTVHDEIARVKDSIRAMEAKRKRDSEAAADEQASGAKKTSWLEESLAQYRDTGKSIFGGRKRRRAADEAQASACCTIYGDPITLAKLNAFTSKLAALSPTSMAGAASSASDAGAKEACELHQVVDCESCGRSMRSSDAKDDDEAVAAPPSEFTGETWNEQGWLSHHLVFEKDTKGKDLMKKRDNIDDYVVIDPRVREAQAKRLDKPDRSTSRRYTDRAEA
ncbi:hypothetical protein SYNPS1DRAFT_21934 [Syncephalis pseudoplumigaleata]|uniref:Uncharacterized protein n=1 Tax=Syncephalis pseudoplumigaleata TaxID=1712513 RepID=A0A4P9Z3A1_9FUNG|nr:hypothetical protein SYNPS1DRAFT_21934 [Syncephalis pseudoplumigaleata]|eukprot:RKP26271.1 hypothetical protein SYNPS1DRAFT_21934 [Syncephalis pseudoplumigaleata]